MSDAQKLRIVSDGTAANTLIYAGGQQIKGIVKIEFDPLVPGGLLTARLTAMVEIDVMAVNRDEEFAQAGGTCN